MENTQKSPKIYKIAFFDTDGIVTIGEEVHTFADAEAMCETLNQANPEMDHIPFHPQRFVWDTDEMEYDPRLDQYIIDADWYDDQIKDIVRVRYPDEVGEAGCIPAWQIENLEEVISKFNM